jgi:hypothetical protein
MKLVHLNHIITLPHPVWTVNLYSFWSLSTHNVTEESCSRTTLSPFNVPLWSTGGYCRISSHGCIDQSDYSTIDSKYCSVVSLIAISLNCMNIVCGRIILEHVCNESFSWAWVRMGKAASSSWSPYLIICISRSLWAHTTQKFTVCSSVLAVTACINEWIHNTRCPGQDWCHYMNCWVMDLEQRIGNTSFWLSRT